MWFAWYFHGRSFRLICEMTSFAGWFSVSYQNGTWIAVVLKDTNFDCLEGNKFFPREFFFLAQAFDYFSVAALDQPHFNLLSQPLWLKEIFFSAKFFICISKWGSFISHEVFYPQCPCLRLLTLTAYLAPSTKYLSSPFSITWANQSKNNKIIVP